MLYRMVTLAISLGDPQPPHFLHFTTSFVFLQWVTLGTSNLVGRFIIACPSLLVTNHPGNERGQL